MWLRTWLLTAFLVVMVLGAAELAWRSQGHRASVVDDLDLWSEQRAQIYGGETTVVLIGTSRIQLGFVSDVFHDRFPRHRLVRLEAPLRHPVSALRNLAEDRAFRGVVIASVAIPWMRKGVYPDLSEELDHYRDHYDWNARGNRRIASFVQSRLVSVNPNVNLRDVLVRWARRGEWPDPLHVVTKADRSRAGDFSLHPDLKRSRKNLVFITKERERLHHVSSEAMLEQLVELDALAERIRERGGNVVFVRLPSSGKIRRIDEKYYPKREYWDRFAARTTAPTLHFLDVPTLADFECADGLHLDQRDAPRFTALLLDELMRMQIFGPPG